MTEELRKILIKTAAEPQEEPFRPTLIGDPVKFAKQTKPFKMSDAAISAGVWMAGALFWGKMMEIWNGKTIDNYWERTDPYAGLKDSEGNPTEDYDKAKFHDRMGKIARLLSAGGAGFLSSVVDQAIGGQPYNYMGYKVPTTPKDIVIAFTGAGSGAHRARKGREHDMDVADLDSRYGKGRYALFNHKHLREAQEFLMNLPPGCRIRIQGHSYGGSSAWKLAQFASDNGIPIDRLDTLDPIGMSPEMQFKGKPELVKVWENHLPKKRRLWYWPDFLATMGHARRELKGADNKIYTEPQYNDHSGIRLVDFAGDKKRNLQYDMNADHPFSAFTEEGLLTKTASDWKDWYREHNVAVNAAAGAVGTGAFTTLLHRLLTEPKDRSWRKDLAYGIPAGMLGGAVGAGATATSNIFGGKSGDKNLGFMGEIADFLAMLKDPKRLKEFDERCADVIKNGKAGDAFIQWFIKTWQKSPDALKSLFLTTLNGTNAQNIKKLTIYANQLGDIDDIESKGSKTVKALTDRANEGIQKAQAAAKATVDAIAGQNEGPKIEIPRDPNASKVRKIPEMMSRMGLEAKTKVDIDPLTKKFRPEQVARLEDEWRNVRFRPNDAANTGAMDTVISPFRALVGKLTGISHDILEGNSKMLAEARANAERKKAAQLAGASK